MRTGTWLILLGLLGIAGVGVYYYQHQIRILQDLTYEVIAFNIINLTLDIATINLTVRIKSNSTLDATVKSIFIDAYINGVKLGTLTNTNNQEFVIPARNAPGQPGYSDVPLEVNFSPKLLVGNLVALLGGISTGQDFTINLIGYLKIKEAFITVSVPFTYATTFQQILKP